MSTNIRPLPLLAMPRVDALIARAEAATTAPHITAFIAARFRELRARRFMSEAETLAACKAFCGEYELKESDQGDIGRIFLVVRGWVAEAEALSVARLPQPRTSALIERLDEEVAACEVERYTMVYHTCADMLRRARYPGADDAAILAAFVERLDSTVESLTDFGEEDRANVYNTVRMWARP